MAEFIIISAAVMAVFWLLRGPKGGAAGAKGRNERQDADKAADGNPPAQVEAAAVAEARPLPDLAPRMGAVAANASEPEPRQPSASSSAGHIAFEITQISEMEANGHATPFDLEDVCEASEAAVPSKEDADAAASSDLAPEVNSGQGAESAGETEALSVAEAVLAEQSAQAVADAPCGERVFPSTSFRDICGGEPESAVEERCPAPAEAADFVIAAPASGGTEPVQTGPAATGNISRGGRPPDDREPSALEDVSIAGPSRYRPPQQRQARRPSAGAAELTRTSRADSVLEIRVRMRLDHFDFCEISLLPECKQDMDDEVTVKAGSMRLVLVAQEDWYADLRFEDIGERMRQGIRLVGLLSDGRRVQWQLSGGRNIYVLASHPSASGFVSVPRLALGRPHAVLCANEVLGQTEAILKQAGCNGYTKLDASHGVPAGWTGLRGVLPETALTLIPCFDPFYALKPAPDINISLEGGLLAHDARWIAGYPPKIKVTGLATGALRVLIDGKEAQTADGYYTAKGFDAAGQHLVECEGLSCSRSYSIEEPGQSWEKWPAYAFHGVDVCGPLVTLRQGAGRRLVFTVPMSNPLLLGAEPGQVFRCSHRNVANWQGFVPFEVVWALPAQPLICDKRTSRILCLSSAPFAPANRSARPPLDWCSAILNAARKGLRVEGSSTAQWTEYKKAARNIWRRRR